MRSAVSLALATSLIGSALPVAARQDERVDAGWSRVRALAPGTDLVVTVKGSQPENRSFVAGDESDLTVLNVGVPALPTAARDVLRRAASAHPEYLLAAQKGAQIVLGKDLRLAPDGVFVADEQVADLRQVVETIARNDVAEISGPVRYSRGHDALVGLGVGAAVGAGLYLVLCHGFGGCTGADAGPLLGTAALFGGMFAGIFSLPAGKRGRHKTTEVIYRAP